MNFYQSTKNEMLAIIVSLLKENVMRTFYSDTFSRLDILSPHHMSHVKSLDLLIWDIPRKRKRVPSREQCMILSLLHAATVPCNMSSPLAKEYRVSMRNVNQRKSNNCFGMHKTCTLSSSVFLPLGVGMFASS